MSTDCPVCNHPWGDHDKSDGCYSGWRYNLDGTLVTEGCGCQLAHVVLSS